MSIDTALTEAQLQDVVMVRAAKMRAASHSPLGNARRRLSWAKKREARLAVQYAEAKAHLEKCETTVRYYEELAKYDAAASA
jgi:hypothetical protein